MKGFVLDASLIYDLDLSACEMLQLFNHELKLRGIQFVIAGLRHIIRRSVTIGWRESLDKNELFKRNVRQAVTAIQPYIV